MDLMWWPSAETEQCRIHDVGSSGALQRLQVEQVELVLLKHKTRPSRPVFCVFCKKNGEPVSFFKGHTLKDGNGDIVCPVLRRYVCPLCCATGAFAHTIKYCPVGNGICGARRNGGGGGGGGGSIGGLMSGRGRWDGNRSALMSESCAVMTDRGEMANRGAIMMDRGVMVNRGARLSECGGVMANRGTRLSECGGVMANCGARLSECGGVMAHRGALMTDFGVLCSGAGTPSMSHRNRPATAPEHGQRSWLKRLPDKFSV